MTTGTVDGPDSGARRGQSWLRRHWFASTVSVVLLGAAAVAGYVWKQVDETLAPEFTDIAYTVPIAPKLVAGTGERVFRIDPTQSELSYTVDEKIFGQGAHTAVGTTHGIAGDLALNAQAPAKSRLGQIVVNVQQLHSDNSLRDARLRKSYLQSNEFPLARLDGVRVVGAPAALRDGQRVSFELHGFLTVRRVAKPIVWKVDATLQGGKFTATGTATVKMSDFKVGPISLVGLVSTADEVKLGLRITALDPSKFAIPATISAPADVKPTGKGPSFAKAVLPILETSCASCHARGEVGAAHWQLETAADAAKYADGIATVVKAKYMPPWPASSKGVPLAHSKQINDTMIDTIVQWAKAGGTLDVPKSTKVVAADTGNVAHPRADVALRMPKAYAGSLSSPNDYRCFVLDPHITESKWMTGYEVTPEHRTQIHHVQIYHVEPQQIARAKELEGADGKPGWSCYGTGSLGSPRGGGAVAAGVGTGAGARIPMRNFSIQPGLIAGWVPGQDPMIYPLKSGILLQPGDAIVMQMHYHYDTEPVPDRSSIALQLEPYSTKIKPIDIVNPIGPVELPCEPGQRAKLCDREAALVEAERLYGPEGRSIEGGLLLLCGKSPEELRANYRNGVGHTSCVTTIPEDGQLVGALGHMHTLGKSFRFTLDPDKPQAKVLLDIPTWNFGWQMDYQLQTPVHVRRGQQLRMDCSWDRSLEPNRAPKYIVFAEGTEDEMCFGTYGIVPDTP